MNRIKDAEVLSIENIFKDKYIIPLYQRNFSWGEEQIVRLLQDIYESMSNEEPYFYIGSLIVLQRNNGELEVIDGQQRLTMLTILSCVLHMGLPLCLHYDSRPEVEDFFRILHRGEIPKNCNENSISHFFEAIEIVRSSQLNANESGQKKTLNDENICTKFAEYIRKNVCLVREIMPADTDVAAYFEIMNNRGEQLQEHEIIKGLLLGQLHEKGLDDISSICAKIWDACSQFETRVQKSFGVNAQRTLFGDNADSLLLNGNSDDADYGEKNVALLKSLVDHSSIVSGQKTLMEILDSSQSTMPNNEDSPENEAIPKEESIIDFPNFLMHVFRLYYNKDYAKLVQDQAKDIPLSDKYLLMVYNILKEKINPLDFFLRLLYCRVIFDRFIIKSNITNEDEAREWVLLKPYIYVYQEGNRKSKSLLYENTFPEKKLQNAIIQSISSLQVSFRTKPYKNFLQTILSWFISTPELMAQEYLAKLHQLMLDEFERTSIAYVGITEYDDKHQGTSVPHYLFNFIDYLYWWLKEHSEEIGFEENDPSVKALKRELECIKKTDFRFLYRNSIEHHYPQKRKEEMKDEAITPYLLNCLGNLVLISKSANSRLSDKNPIDKATLYNGRTDLPPTRQIIYQITRNEGWGIQQIQRHHNCIEELIKLRKSILRC